MKRILKKHKEITVKPDFYEGVSLPFEVKPNRKNPVTKFVKYSMTWYNSNHLLTVPGFNGVKTGHTMTAGYCLSVSYECDACKLITVVMGSKSIHDRFQDARRLTLWAAEMIKSGFEK